MDYQLTTNTLSRIRHRCANHRRTHQLLPLLLLLPDSLHTYHSNQRWSPSIFPRHHSTKASPMANKPRSHNKKASSRPTIKRQTQAPQEQQHHNSTCTVTITTTTHHSTRTQRYLQQATKYDNAITAPTTFSSTPRTSTSSTSTNTSTSYPVPIVDSNTRTNAIFACFEPVTGEIHCNQTEKFLVSSRGNKYIFLLYDYDSSYIWVRTMPSRTKEQILAKYTEVVELLTSRCFKPQLHHLDNEASNILNQYMTREKLTISSFQPVSTDGTM